ncbi:MAG: hypothetical protein PHP82_02065 [Candidatus ainarchaeum sp.]|nr:hypothetical protein [Candidatus ainarchaeum sp.]
MRIVEDYCRININDCYPNYCDLSKKQRENIKFMKESLKNKEYVKVSFDEWEFDINLAHTKTNFGGVRNWYVCPVCKKKYSILYFDKEQEKCACRKCLKLTYNLTANSHKKSYYISKLCKSWAIVDILNATTNKSAKQKRKLYKNFETMHSLFEQYKRFTEDKLEKLYSDPQTI